MNSPKDSKLLVAFLLFVFAFVFLFYPTGLGVNVLIYALLLVSGARLLHREKTYGPPDYLIQGGLLLSSVMLVLHHNMWSLFVLIMFGTCLIGQSVALSLSSVFHTYALGLSSFFLSYKKMFSSWSNFRVGRYSLKRVFRFAKVVFIPSFIILMFLGLYSFASPGFNSMLSEFSVVWNEIASLLEALNPRFLSLLILAIIIHTAFVYFRPNQWIKVSGEKGEDQLKRSRTGQMSKFNKPMDLLIEYRSGVYLLIVLNVLLACVNYFDVVNVWFKFNWTGEYLREYVHQGTRILLLSILISIIIVLYYFRGNLNFYKKNKKLKLLAKLWLMQNALLCISVGVRTVQYVAHFNLAYRRIALFFFLILVLFAVVSVFIKINKAKSPFYLIRVNGWAWATVMIVSTFVDWNGFIARYNLAHYKTAFVHFEYLSEMPNSTLDELQLTEEEVDSFRHNRVRPSEITRERYMSTEEFKEIIDRRRDEFTNEWKSRSVLAWNYADYKAIKRLKR